LGTNAEDRTKPKFSFSVIIRYYLGMEKIESEAQPESQKAAETVEQTEPKPQQSKADHTDDEDMQNFFHGKLKSASKPLAAAPEAPSTKIAEVGTIKRVAFFVTVVRNPKFSPEVHVHPWLFNTFKPLEDQTRIE
jgi:hypothetical protein